jgi:hypothetical protein
MIYESQPVFIHSLFRSGSTYFFNVFRRSPAKYWCYQEPLNEYLLHAATAPERLLDIHEQTSTYLRHPSLSRPYFYEFYPLATEVGRLFRKEFPYDHYFLSETDDITDLKAYLTALIEGAQGRPVFQCCRSAGRVARCHKECGGKHIFLWRNPWDQWWSYKVDYYFDKVNLMIANAQSPPLFIRQLRNDLGITPFHSHDIWLEFKHFDLHRLDAAGSYTLFYALWCHAMLEARPYCDISINIDQLSLSELYRNEILSALDDMGIKGLDLSDAAIPIGVYGKQDVDFFSGLEDRVHGLLLQNGYNQAQVDEMLALRREHTIPSNEIGPLDQVLARDALRARELSRRYETEIHYWQNELNLADQRANQAEANAREAQAHAEQAQARAREASEHAVAAEARAEHAEAKAEQAELQAAQANERANQAEANTREAQAHAEQAEARAHEAEQRLAALYNSISWRITAPLRTPPVRFVYRQIIHIKEQGFIGRVKFVSGNLLKIGEAKAVHFIEDHPGLYNTVLKWLHRLGLYEQARAFYRKVTRHNSDAPSACPAPPVMDTGLEDLSPRAREIYLQLKEAIEKRHK